MTRDLSHPSVDVWIGLLNVEDGEQGTEGMMVVGGKTKRGTAKRFALSIATNARVINSTSDPDKPNCIDPSYYHITQPGVP